jgi:3-hydroxyisobutyrate dehydrogenase-like beta-hydroxyacid dehydrogenase
MIGFIGLGDIGLPMAMRLLDVGHTLTVWNRTPEKAAPLVARGATLAESPAALFATCDLIGLCLTSHDAVSDVAAALFAAAPTDRRRTIVDLSTGAAERTVEQARLAASHGIGWVDSPVSGGVPAAATGTLTLFVGGEEADIAAAAPLLTALGARQTVMGGPGSGQAAKICNQMIVACSLLVIAETIATARKAGIDVTNLPEALRGGFADSLPLQIFGNRMATHSFEPRLGAIALMTKDLSLARAMAARVDATAPVSALCAKLYAQIADPQADLSHVIELFEPVG